MDDLVISVPTTREADNLCTESLRLFKAGKFESTKWISNSAELVKGIPEEDRARLKAVSFGCKALGVCWDPVTDNLMMNFPEPSDRTIR